MGTHSSEPALTLIGISPLRGSHRDALFSCGGLVTTRLETGRKYHYFFCLSSPSIRIAPYRLNRGAIARSRGLPFCDNRRKVKGAQDIQLSKVRLTSFMVDRLLKGLYNRI